MPWHMTREDGPNDTAANKTISYNNGPGTMTLHSQDETFDGVPSRVIKNMAVNVEDVDMANVPSYTQKGVETELNDISSTGRQQLVTPVTDPTQTVANKRLATESGASYTEVQKDGQNFGVFVPGQRNSSSLLDDSFNVATALSNDYSTDELRGFLTSKGYDEAQVNDMMVQSAKIVQAREAGYQDDEIRQFLGSREMSVQEVVSEPEVQDVPERQEWVATQWGAVPKRTADERIKSNETMSAEDLLAGLKVLAPNMSSMTTRTVGFFGNEEAAKKAEATAIASRQRIIELASEYDLNLSWDDQLNNFVATTDDGGQVVVDEGFWRSIMSEKGELIGAVGGAVSGAKVGARFGPWGALAGSVVGAATGSAIGSQLDYLQQAAKLHQDLEGRVMAHKAFTAAEMSVIGDLIGFGAFRASGAAFNGMRRVKDFLIDGNTEGAYRAMKEIEFVTDSQAQDAVNQLNRMINGDLAGGPKEAAIQAVTLTKPGAESLVKATASVDPQASRAIAKAIDDRAKDLLKTTDELSGENLGRLLREDLGNYITDTKQFFEKVKSEAAQSPRASNFRFDYDKIALQPVIDTLQKNITDPSVLEKFKLQAQRVRGMSDSRTFGDLLELRQIVNDFKFNKRITKAKDFQALNQVLNNIDSVITQGSNFVLENPAKWRADYAEARKSYAKMKNIERNVMFKAMTKPGVDETVITRNLSKYITALDGTFNDLMRELPMSMRGRVENSVIDTLANKYTAGVGVSTRATNFPLLANDLNMVTFTTPEARQMKSAITELAEVFKNDVPLSQATGNIQIPQFQSYLTADPVVRAKYEAASRMFNYVKTLLPNKDQETLALVRKTSQLLENPLNSKAVKDLMEESAGKVDLSQDVLRLQQEAARAAASGRDPVSPRVKLYGNGSTLSTKAGSGAEQSIPLHRIATTEDARLIAEGEGINFTDTKLLDGVLATYGYKAVQQGSDRVRLL